MAAESADIDTRYQEIIKYLTKDPWRKKALMVLVAEKENISEKTVGNRLDDLEERGVIEMVRMSGNNVLVERNNEYRYNIDLKIDNLSKIQRLLEQTHNHAKSISQKTFPFQSNHDTTAKSTLLPNFISPIITSISNTLPSAEVRKLAKNINELKTISDQQLLVVSDESYLSYIFNILDNLLFVLHTYTEIDGSEEDGSLISVFLDAVDTYFSFINGVSSSAAVIGCAEKYDSKMSERTHELQQILQTGPDTVKQTIYYLIHAHGDTPAKINAFTYYMKEDELDYYDLSNTIRELYTEKERAKLHTRLKSILDELNGQQQLVKLLCDDIRKYNHSTQINYKKRYYNQTKKKIIAILSHGSKKLDKIEELAAGSKGNISTNLDQLSDDEYVTNQNTLHGYYKLEQDIKKSFEQKREKTPKAQSHKINEALDSDWREFNLYVGLFVFDHEKKFILNTKSKLDAFFNILDESIAVIQNEYLLNVTPIQVLFFIARKLHEQWEKGLENIHYHSELANRLDDLKKAHDHASPNARKYIRNLIAKIDFNQVEDLFKQAVVDGEEEIEDIKKSIKDIYYDNNKMHRIVEYLRSLDHSPSVENEEYRNELLEYSVNLPYKSPH